MTDKPRQRFLGSDAELEAALAIRSPTEIKYHELKIGSDDVAQIEKFKVDPAGIMVQKERLVRLHALQPNLCFRRKQVLATLLRVADKNSQWQYSSELKKQFATVTTNRLMALFRDVSQAMARKKPPRWVSDLFDNIAPPGETPAEASSDALVAVEPSTTSYFCGYSQEMQQAWRCSSADKRENRQYTADLRPNPRGDMEPAIAVWPDGFQHELAELLSKSVVEMARAKEASSSHATLEVYYSGVLQNGSKITVKDRSEGPKRPPIVSIWQDGKQIGQVPMTRGVDHDTAVTVAKQVAASFVAGTIDKDGLYTLRDKLVS